MVELVPLPAAEEAVGQETVSRAAVALADDDRVIPGVLLEHLDLDREEAGAARHDDDFLLPRAGIVQATRRRRLGGSPSAAAATEHGGPV